MLLVARHNGAQTRHVAAPDPESRLATIRRVAWDYGINLVKTTVTPTSKKRPSKVDLDRTNGTAGHAGHAGHGTAVRAGTRRPGHAT